MLAQMAAFWRRNPTRRVIGHAHGDGLSGINDASSAYGQNKADAFPAAELNTLMDQGQPGIRLNAPSSTKETPDSRREAATRS